MAEMLAPFAYQCYGGMHQIYHERQQVYGTES